MPVGPANTQCLLNIRSKTSNDWLYVHRLRKHHTTHSLVLLPLRPPSVEFPPPRSPLPSYPGPQASIRFLARLKTNPRAFQLWKTFGLRCTCHS